MSCKHRHTASVIKTGSGSGPHLLGLCLEGGRQHVGEEFEGDRKQELHEGDDDEDEEGEEPEDVGARSEELERKR